jgi:hypothetical protein
MNFGFPLTPHLKFSIPSGIEKNRTPSLINEFCRKIALTLGGTFKREEWNSWSLFPVTITEA